MLVVTGDIWTYAAYVTGRGWTREWLTDVAARCIHQSSSEAVEVVIRIES